ncbi:MAG: hypothetical protein ACYDHW_11980 [Syntrophorhabdaceae bacterium]
MMCNKTCSLFNDIAAIKYIACIFLVVLLLSGTYRDGNAAPADEAAALRQKFTAIKPRLEKNQFQRPLYLDSTETGDIYAIMDYPFSEVRKALSDPEHAPPNWCDIMMLHPNTKYCRVAPANGKKILKVRIGKKSEQPLEDAHPMQFNYRFEQGISDYFRVDLTAEKGPLGTKDYRVVINAVPLDDKRTFLHLAYACSANLAARSAMRVYLATIGRDKVGFTILGTFRDGEIQYIDGIRGVVERNTMRYYLAIDAFLYSLSVSPEKRLEKRLLKWFGGTERYARQLFELGPDEYMQMKLDEYKRIPLVP